MRRKILYYAQLGEALKLAQSNIFGYKRISLILFDNIIENLLVTQNAIELQHLLAMSKMKKTEYEKIIDSFNRFEKIIHQSYVLKLIDESEKNIIKYCHQARNNLYHNLFADKRVTDFCILFYCKFLEEKFAIFIEIGITSSSERESKSINEILKVEKVKNLEGIISNLKTFNQTQVGEPQKKLAGIIEDYILQIEETMENETFESFEKLNSVAKDLYNDNFKNIKHNGLNPSGFIKKWESLSELKINEMKHAVTEISNCSLESSFEKYHKLMLKIEPIYIGIMLNYSNEECLASLFED